MTKAVKSRIVFLGKSFLWAALLFVVFMSLINWDSIKPGFSGNYITISNSKDTIIRKVKPVVIRSRVSVVLLDRICSLYVREGMDRFN